AARGKGRPAEVEARSAEVEVWFVQVEVWSACPTAVWSPGVAGWVVVPRLPSAARSSRLPRSRSGSSCVRKLTPDDPSSRPDHDAAPPPTPPYVVSPWSVLTTGDRPRCRFSQE